MHAHSIKFFSYINSNILSNKISDWNGKIKYNYPDKIK